MDPKNTNNKGFNQQANNARKPGSIVELLAIPEGTDDVEFEPPRLRDELLGIPERS